MGPHEVHEHRSTVQTIGGADLPGWVAYSAGHTFTIEPMLALVGGHTPLLDRWYILVMRLSIRAANWPN